MEKLLDDSLRIEVECLLVQTSLNEALDRAHHRGIAYACILHPQGEISLHFLSGNHPEGKSLLSCAGIHRLGMMDALELIRAEEAALSGRAHARETREPRLWADSYSQPVAHAIPMTIPQLPARVPEREVLQPDVVNKLLADAISHGLHLPPHVQALQQQPIYAAPSPYQQAYVEPPTDPRLRALPDPRYQRNPYEMQSAPPQQEVNMKTPAETLSLLQSLLGKLQEKQ